MKIIEFPHVELILSLMKCGKSDDLNEFAKKLRHFKKRVEIFDCREWMLLNGMKRPNRAVITYFAREIAKLKAGDYLLIDELWLMQGDIDDFRYLFNELRHLNIKAASLAINRKNEPWPVIEELKYYVNNVIYKSKQCEDCGERLATKHRRKARHTRDIELNKLVYQDVCSDCLAKDSGDLLLLKEIHEG